MTRNNVVFPPFSELCNFVSDMAKLMNNPSFVYEDPVET